MERVISYIDGFNLYFGLKSSGFGRFYWLNVHALSVNLLRSNQQLVCTKYFTSRISGPPDKAHRQNTFLEAVQTVANCGIFYGHYLSSTRTCRNCGFVYQLQTEKMTDVNIATEMLTDAFQDKFDTALLLSADSDLTAPVKAVQTLFPTKQVIVAFPPSRDSVTLKHVARGYFYVSRSKLARSQFPDDVRKPDGFVLRRPPTWR